MSKSERRKQILYKYLIQSVHYYKILKNLVIIMMIIIIIMEDCTIGKYHLLESYELIQNLVNNELYKVKKVRKNS